MYACMCVYTILNPPGKRAERHNDPTPALPMAIRMRITDSHTPRESIAIHTHTHIRARNTSHVCPPGERIDRGAKRVRGTSAGPARYRTICLENNGNACRAARARMNIKGLSNDWVSQKSGLLPTRDSPPARRGMQI